MPAPISRWGIVPFLDPQINRFPYNGRGINIIMNNPTDQPRMNIGFKGTGYVGDIQQYNPNEPEPDPNDWEKIIGEEKRNAVGEPVYNHWNSKRPFYKVWPGGKEKPFLWSGGHAGGLDGLSFFHSRHPKSVLRISVMADGLMYKDDLPTVAIKVVPPAHGMNASQVFLNSPDVPVFFASPTHSFL
eukprot:GEMP01072687.1.p1 GENE.GEMP01072687.1~~GEMP01072687.1.p1  ORF type:complete len:186 (+),score=34.62 GEMP01072687.1:175-732(+)